LHRRVENTEKVLARFDVNNDTKLDLEGSSLLSIILTDFLEFSTLDFSFPWEEFPVNLGTDRPLVTKSVYSKSK
jgi:hypothetical protein